ncbi:GNAT family N-acetyltransferase [Cumulibacter manganitolerans]|uniref:GNAT family N-acetyltransferase n=1 Tax=Cumulibacter manganitolerans TaxID=1884992 RepID=UPI001297EDB3|nr:GNAT family N-acetyltransferase [Cumulibacter manganitolerans]
MSEPTYRLAALDSTFDLARFDCGESAYNTWLTDTALRANESGSSAVYVLLEQAGHEREQVVGYFAICPTTVVRDAMPKPLQRGMLRATPGWLLAKLAINRSLREQRRGWGRHLLREALEVIVDAAERGGGAVIVVDADNEGLISFYERNGFVSTGAGNLRMFLKLATARAYLRPSDR